MKHLLEEETISVDDQDEGSATAILKAAYSGNVEIAQMLINRKCFISAEDKDGNNALLVAAMRNHTELALLVIKYGIDVSCVNQSGDKFEYFFLKFFVVLACSKFLEIVHFGFLFITRTWQS